MKINVGMVKIPVSDIDLALPFYQNVLGLTVEFAVAEYGWAQLKAGNLPVALYVSGKGGGNAKAGESDHLHFTVDNLADFREHLITQDIDPDAHYHQSAEGSHHYELQDTDGNTFKIMEASI